jgi:hypothetical protein
VPASSRIFNQISEQPNVGRPFRASSIAIRMKKGALPLLLSGNDSEGSITTRIKRCIGSKPVIAGYLSAANGRSNFLAVQVLADKSFKLC